MAGLQVLGLQGAIRAPQDAHCWSSEPEIIEFGLLKKYIPPQNTRENCPLTDWIQGCTSIFVYPVSLHFSPC